MSDTKLSEKQAYEEGSAALRNYSSLTQQVRVVTVIAIVAALAKLDIFAPLDKTNPGAGLVGVSVELGVFLIGLATVLTLVAWHYQSAFTVIRNCMHKLEHSQGIIGPWSGHKLVRNKYSDLASTYVPFILMAGLGGIMIGWNPWLLTLALPLLALYFARRLDGNIELAILEEALPTVVGDEGSAAESHKGQV